MMKKILIGALSFSLTVGGFLPIVVSYGQEETTNNMAMDSTEIESLMESGYIETFKGLLYEAGFTDEMLADVPSDTLYTLAENYLRQHGNTSNVAEAYRLAMPEISWIFRSGENSSNLTPPADPVTGDYMNIQPPKPYTEEEAIQKTNDGFLDEYLYSLKYYGITDEMLAQLPENAVYDACVAYITGKTQLGDIMMPYRHFTALYPEVLNSNVKDIQIDSSSKDERIKNANKTLEQQEKLSQHVNEIKFENNNIKELPLDFIINTKEGSYTGKYTFLLTPKEAGNISEDNYLFGIKYEFKNTTDHEVKDYKTLVHDFITISQKKDEKVNKLKVAVYELPNQTEQTAITDPVKPGAIVSFNVYYEVINLESPLIASVVADDGKIEDYDLNIDSLIKLPLQSALYFSNDGSGFLFDFNTIYHIKTKEIEENSNKSKLDSDDLSVEAKLLLNDLDTSSLIADKFENIHYKITDNGQIEILDESNKLLFTILSDSSWKDFTDGEGNSYVLN